MIFSNNVYKISSGTNLSFYFENSSDLILYVFNGITYLKKINIKNGFRCVNMGKAYNYHKVTKLNNNHLAICFDKNISVVSNE